MQVENMTTIDEKRPFSSSLHNTMWLPEDPIVDTNMQILSDIDGMIDVCNFRINHFAGANDSFEVIKRVNHPFFRWKNSIRHLWISLLVFSCSHNFRKCHSQLESGQL